MEMALLVLGIVLAAVAAGIVFVFLFIPFIKLIGRLVTHVFGTLFAWVADIVRFLGTVLVVPVFVVLTAVSVVIGRWSAAAHYGRALSGEIRSAGLGVYRIALGHPLRLIGLHGLVEGFEKRIPEVVAAAPGSDRPRGRASQFDGYSIVGSLAGGGSGGRLYIAEPDELKRAAFVRRGLGDIDRVVLKTFSIHEGSTLPQIIRESRALDAAKRLGLILEHDLTNERFFYAMRYIPGEALGLVAQRAHADAGPDGLADPALRRLLGYARDILLTLHRYHTGGLWHKDIKPDNIIVDQDRAHIVDLGLITPLRSAMTLTTHGTEYFRDPELVRLALKGVKVSEVNGAKFDIYGAAAVIFAMVEGSFPAHGGLSQITRRCPEALRWIIRRGMTDYDRRYDSAQEMLADLDALLAAPGLSEIRPAQLPSMRGTVQAAEPEAPRDEFAPAPQPAPVPAPVHRGSPRPPGIRIVKGGWWSGRYEVDAGAQAAPSEARAPQPAPRAARAPRPVPVTRRPAHEQLQNARARAAERRTRAAARLSRHTRARRGPAEPGINRGVAVAVGLVAGLAAIPIALALSDRGEAAQPAQAVIAAPPRAPKPPRLTVMSRDGEAVSVPASVVKRGSALVLSTFRAPVDTTIEAALRLTIDRLRASGFELSENIVAPGEEAIAHFAELSAVRTLAPADAAEAAESIARWRRGVSPEIDVVVVLEPDPEAASRGEHAGRAIVVGRDASVALHGIDPDHIAHHAAKARGD
jgi:hypothetical protein